MAGGKGTAQVRHQSHNESHNEGKGWETVIGLEVHAQVASQTKLFSGAPVAFGAEPNTEVSLIDAAMPGMLPVINKEAITQAVRTGLALDAEINLESVFARKNYFYPDLPQGYQISQYEQPVVGEGRIEINLEDGDTRCVRIERLHLEQDAGKLIHDQHPSLSFVDLNRSGVALMEIVTMPDMRSPEEAGVFVAKLRAILRAVGSCDGNMEEGSLRVDANVSVRRPGDKLGTRCEIKNLNSIRFLRQAIAYEVRRQIELREEGGTVVQETRLFDPDQGRTRPMRAKEDANDYRYFPDPDLLPLVLDAAWVEELRGALPELPDARRERFMQQFDLSREEATLLAGNRETAAFFEAAAEARDARTIAHWMTTELFGRLNRAGSEIGMSPVSPAALGGLVDLLGEGKVSGPVAKEVFDAMFESGAVEASAAAAIVAERGLEQITDSDALTAIVDEVIAGASKQADEFRGGNEKVMGWFVGQVMKASRGKADPKAVSVLLRDRLLR